MTLSKLPLSYCTNVHPGRTVAEVISGLQNYTSQLPCQTSQDVAAGLWLARSVVDELMSDPSALVILKRVLEDHNLVCYTLNGFPYGDFHSDRVKEQVYLPDWSSPLRRDYTLDCATVLAYLLPKNMEGSISTVPLAFKLFDHDHDFLSLAIQELIQTSQSLQKLEEQTGKRIRLAIEPEPFCWLETTEETITFFQQLREEAANQNCLDVVTETIGVCYDVCHQAVEFEDVVESLNSLRKEQIRINKVHISCALECEEPLHSTEARKFLSSFAEPRYLHQLVAKTTSGQLIRHVDLTKELALEPSEDLAESAAWRVHFHVPVHREEIGPLKTTRQDLLKSLETVAEFDYAPHLEIETYTWNVMPGEEAVDLVTGLSDEFRSTSDFLQHLQD